MTLVAVLLGFTLSVAAPLTNLRQKRIVEGMSRKRRRQKQIYNFKIKEVMDIWLCNGYIFSEYNYGRNTEVYFERIIMSDAVNRDEKC